MGRSKRNIEPQYCKVEPRTGPLVKLFLTQSHHSAFIRPGTRSTLLTSPRRPNASSTTKRTSVVADQEEAAPLALWTSAQKRKFIDSLQRVVRWKVSCRCIESRRAVSAIDGIVPRLGAVLPGSASHRAGCRFARVLSEEVEENGATKATTSCAKGGQVTSGPARRHARVREAEVAKARVVQGKAAKRGTAEARIAKARDLGDKLSKREVAEAKTTQNENIRPPSAVTVQQPTALADQQDNLVAQRRRSISETVIVSKNMILLRGQHRMQKRAYKKQRAEWKTQLKLLRKRRKALEKDDRCEKWLPLGTLASQ